MVGDEPVVCVLCGTIMTYYASDDVWRCDECGTEAAQETPERWREYADPYCGLEGLFEAEVADKKRLARLGRGGSLNNRRKRRKEYNWRPRYVETEEVVQKWNRQLGTA